VADSDIVTPNRLRQLVREVVREEVGVQQRLADALEVIARSAAPTNLEKPLLTSKEAAALLGTTPKGLEALRRRGKLPPSVGPGRRLLFRREDLLTCASREPSPRRTRR
jgi:hypothetical protein